MSDLTAKFNSLEENFFSSKFSRLATMIVAVALSIADIVLCIQNEWIETGELIEYVAILICLILLPISLLKKETGLAHAMMAETLAINAFIELGYIADEILGYNYEVIITYKSHEAYIAFQIIDAIIILAVFINHFVSELKSDKATRISNKANRLLISFLVLSSIAECIYYIYLINDAEFAEDKIVFIELVLSTIANLCIQFNVVCCDSYIEKLHTQNAPLEEQINI